MIDKYKAVVFDWDGTLVDTCGLILDAHNHVRTYMGHPLWTMDDFLGQASKSAREYYPEVYGDRADEAQKVLYDFVEAHHLTYLKPMAMAQEMLDLFQTWQVPLAVVSNKRHNTLNIEVAHMGWPDRFRSVIGAGQAARDKPSPDPLLMALNQIDTLIKPADILYVGDTETDLLCAKNAGCAIALIQSDRPRPDLLEKYNPAYAYDDLAQFIENVIASKQESDAIRAC
ncbi:MAG TPA: HAD family hydrolase [Alphaproteobacteria bacterium]|nr:HAD family hydrolase [Alphaproteobacteria bacterium]